MQGYFRVENSILVQNFLFNVKENQNFESPEFNGRKTLRALDSKSFEKLPDVILKFTYPLILTFDLDLYLC